MEQAKSLGSIKAGTASAIYCDIHKTIFVSDISQYQTEDRCMEIQTLCIE